MTRHSVTFRGSDRHHTHNRPTFRRSSLEAQPTGAYHLADRDSVPGPDGAGAFVKICVAFVGVKSPFAFAYQINLSRQDYFDPQ